MFRTLFLIFISLFLANCSLIAPKNETQLAGQAAEVFFEHLSAGRYADAAEMYAGDYSALTSLTSLIPPGDLAALWKNGCEISGLQCLPIYQIVSAEKFSLNEFRITVEFRDKAGGVFMLGPCCGATTEEMPPVSQFDIYVIERDGGYYITSLPVFVP
jgi:hypothetical protein